MENLAVFALLGLLVGSAAPALYGVRQPKGVSGTVPLGMTGALVGGMVSGRYWRFDDGRFQSANVLAAVLGAAAVIVLWAMTTRVRRPLNYRDLCQ